MDIERKALWCALESPTARAKLIACSNDAVQLFQSQHARHIARALIGIDGLDYIDPIELVNVPPRAIDWLNEECGLGSKLSADAGMDRYLPQLEAVALTEQAKATMAIASHSIQNVEDAERAIHALSQLHRENGIVDGAAAMARWRTWKNRMENEPPIPQPFEELEKMMNLRLGQAWFVAARPGVGKTRWTVQQAIIAAKAGMPVLYVTLEMPLPVLVDIFVSMCPTYGVRLEDLPIHFFESKRPSISIERFSSLVNHVSETAKLVVLDHFKLVQDEGASDEYRSMCAVAINIASIAKRGPAIMTVCHVNRSGGQADRLDMHHLSGCGRIEEVADAILMLSIDNVRLAKARYGRVGNLAVALDDKLGKWRQHDIETSGD